jgi:hypothetical protein
LPFPGDALHLVILGQTGMPEGQEETGTKPIPEVLVHGTGTAVLLLGQGLPLASGPEHIYDTLEDLARIDGFASTARPPLECPSLVPLPLGNEGFYPFPEFIRYFPRSDLGHTITSRQEYSMAERLLQVNYG